MQQRKSLAVQSSRGRVGRSYLAFKNWSLKKKLLVGALLSSGLLLITPLVTYAYFVQDISDRERLMNRNSTGIQLVDRNDKPFYTFGKISQQNDYKLTDIPKDLQEAAIASEDKDFYSHPGFSIKGIVAALYANILNKDATKFGGSTITQQLVKNNLLTSGKSYLRKYQEFSIAVAIDRQYTKDEILEMYLNSVYFGEGAFGIQAASKAYFNKEPKDLSLAESSMLIGILPAPTAYSPISGDVNDAKTQQNRVLRQMVANKYITNTERSNALKTKLTYQTAPDAVNENAEHFAQMVMMELNKKYGEERVARSGFTVKTGLDLNAQIFAEDQIKKRVDQLGAQGARNSSLVAIDPKTNEIRALVGSADWDNKTFGKVNMATTLRQPGSSFKPIYHAEALDKKIITPATILNDTPKTFGSYEPQNFDFKFQGKITARKALAQSRNLTAIEVIEKLGVEEASVAAQRLGIKSINQPEKYGLPLALGTAEATLIDMTNAYAAFANAGQQAKPVSIVSIKDKFKKEIFKNEVEQKEAQSEESSFLISSMLSDTQARAPTFSSLNIPGKTVAVKTGTTDNNKDAWTIGYTPSLAIGVWLGNNENEPMSGVAGASGAGPIWRNTMQEMISKNPDEKFIQPASVERVLVCSENGGRADKAGEGTYNEFFIKGTAPTQGCKVQEEKKEEAKPEEKPAEDKEKEVMEEKKDEGTGTTTPPTSTQPILVQCNDKLDNDNDGLTDFAASGGDPGCASATDNSEADGSPNTGEAPPVGGGDPAQEVVSPTLEPTPTSTAAA